MQNPRRLFKHLLAEWLPNAALAAGLVLLVNFNLIIVAFFLVLLSKWQIFRGGRKLWLRNIRDNGCDLVVAISSIMLLVHFRNDLALQISSATIYYVWLVAIKPLHGHIGVAAQAAICQFLGLMVVFLLARDMPAIAVVGLAWLGGLVAADHLVSAFHERAHWILTFIWALLVAQGSWLFWNWLIMYSLLDGRLQIPQPAIVLGLTSYIFGNMYLDHMQTKLGKRRLIEYVLLMFGLSIVLIFGTQWDTQL